MFKGRHFDRSVILLCVRWYLAYGLSLRNLEEMMAERGLEVDHATIHRWTVHYAPLVLEHFNRRKRAVSRRWHVDETYIKVRGRWMYLYRAIDSNGDTVEFWFSERRNLHCRQAVPAQSAEAAWPARANCHRRQSDQPRGDPVLRYDRPSPGPIETSAQADPDPAEPLLE